MTLTTETQTTTLTLATHSSSREMRQLSLADQSSAQIYRIAAFFCFDPYFILKTRSFNWQVSWSNIEHLIILNQNDANFNIDLMRLGVYTSKTSGFYYSFSTSGRGDKYVCNAVCFPS
jgi:hypothetical protein